jgi:hypothetical protein
MSTYHSDNTNCGTDPDDHESDQDVPQEFSVPPTHAIVSKSFCKAFQATKTQSRLAEGKSA